MKKIQNYLKTNFFYSLGSSVVTLVFLALIINPFINVMNWLIVEATYIGGAEACANNPDGACWSFVFYRWEQFLYGSYFKLERYRIDFLLWLLITGLTFLFFSLEVRRIKKVRNILLSLFFLYALFFSYLEHFHHASLVWVLFPKILVLSLLYYYWNHRYSQIGVGVFMIIFFPIISAILLIGGFFGLPFVATHYWGGLSLTLIIALFGIIFALPLGILLALARQSSLPVFHYFAVFFIEFWRGIPLVAALFIGSVLLGYFLPIDWHINDLLRALIAVAFFASAYMAEVVRGGLQVIDSGQYEAADSLGLNYFQKTTFVVLPQALKIVIPGIVNIFIGLFKDTTLVLIIGLFDLLGIVQNALSDPSWAIRSVPFTGYVFVGLVFWVFCYFMSRYSQSLEKKLSQGQYK